MKNKELIEKLKQLPLDLEVAILNITEASEKGTGDEKGSSEGFYHIHEVVKESGVGDLKEFITIAFNE